jgi:sugar/nucleoside kinase (ribokinase family)
MNHRNEGPYVVVVGSMNCDFRETASDVTGTHMLSDKPFHGGKGLNHSVQLARLGTRVALFGSIGHDNHGRLLEAFIAKENIELADPRRIAPHLKKAHEERTGLTLFSTKPEVRYFHIKGANDLDYTHELTFNAQYWNGAPCVLVDLETNPVNRLKAIQLAHEAGAIVVVDGSHPAEQIDDIIGEIDVLIVRRRDMKCLIEDAQYEQSAEQLATGTGNPYETFRDCARRLMFSRAGHGPKCVVFGLETEGCMWAVNEGEGRVQVGRTVGPGRALPYQNSAHAAFAGALVHCIAERRKECPEKEPREFVSTLEWGQICRFASVAYAVAATKVGASESMALRQEIEAMGQSMQIATRTILSVDIVGSTKLIDGDPLGAQTLLTVMAEKIEPKLNLYRPRLVEWRGDGYWVVFDSVSMAIDASLDVARELEADATIPRCRIGLNTGDVIVGQGGTAEGLPAHIAKRVEGLAKPGDVTVSRWTRSLLDDSYICEPVEPNGEFREGERRFELFKVTGRNRDSQWPGPS